MSDAGDQLTPDQPAAQPTVALAQQRGSFAGLRGSELAREAELLGVEFSADLSEWELFEFGAPSSGLSLPSAGRRTLAVLRSASLVVPSGCPLPVRDPRTPLQPSALRGRPLAVCLDFWGLFSKP